MKKLFTLFFLIMVSLGRAQNPLPLIPQPKELTPNKGTFTLNQGTLLLVATSESDAEIELFNQFLITTDSVFVVT